MYDPDTLDLFRSVPFEAIADALDVVTRKKQYLSHRIKHMAGARMVGAAATLMAAPTAERAQHIAGNKLLDGAEPGSVVVVELGGETDAALWGAAEIAVAIERGLAGFVGDGAVRSVAQAQGRPFGIYATNVVPAGGFGRLKTMFHNAPIKCGDVDIFPGDLIVADIDGVLSIPKVIVPNVAALIPAYTQRQLKRIEAGVEFRSITIANGLHWNVE